MFHPYGSVGLIPVLCYLTCCHCMFVFLPCSLHLGRKPHFLRGNYEALFEAIKKARHNSCLAERHYYAKPLWTFCICFPPPRAYTESPSKSYSLFNHFCKLISLRLHQKQLKKCVVHISITSFPLLPAPQALVYQCSGLGLC